MSEALQTAPPAAVEVIPVEPAPADTSGLPVGNLVKAGLAIGLVGYAVNQYLVPSSVLPSADHCSDSSHALYVNAKHADPQTVDDEVAKLQHDWGYAMSPATFMSANPELVRHDKQGRLVQELGKTSSEGICISLPLPVPGGFEMVVRGQTLESIADDMLLSVPQLEALNPQLAHTAPKHGLEAGTMVRVSHSVDPTLVTTAASGTINEMSRNDPALRDAILTDNASLIASGKQIDTGTPGQFPLAPTNIMSERHIDPASIAINYAKNGAYNVVPLASVNITPAAEPKKPAVQAPAPAAPKVEAPAPAVETKQPLSESVVQQMFPNAKPADLHQMYTLVMQSLQKRHLDDPDMVLYTFATLRAETPHAVSIKEYGGEKQSYAPYEGRGYGQLTLKDHYQAFGDAEGVDLINNPDLLLDPALSAESVGFFMDTHQKAIRTALKSYDLEKLRAIYNGRDPKTHIPNGMVPFTQAWNTGWALTHPNGN